MLYKLFSRNMRSHSIRIAIKYAWPKLITNKRYFSSIWGIRKKIFRAFMRSSRNKVTIDVRCKWWISGRSCLYKIEFANLQTNVAMSRVCPILNPCKVVNVYENNCHLCSIVHPMRGYNFENIVDDV
jgi:hypothetical protein